MDVYSFFAVNAPGIHDGSDPDSNGILDTDLLTGDARCMEGMRIHPDSTKRFKNPFSDDRKVGECIYRGVPASDGFFLGIEDVVA